MRLTNKITPEERQWYENEGIALQVVIDYMAKGASKAKDIYNKLGQLEDIEEELGIDLRIFVKMIIGTVVYSKNKNGDIIEQNFNIYIHSILHKCFCLNICDQKTPMYYFKDYGKTWALTKEELTDGKL